MTDELIALLKAAKTEEEAKEILLAHKSDLTDEELEKISGGTLGITATAIVGTAAAVVYTATIVIKVTDSADCF